MISRSPALVVGFEKNGLAIARALGREGIPIIAIASRNHGFETASRYCTKLLLADLENMELINRLQFVSDRLSDRPPLFLTTDRAVQLISKHRNILDPFYRIALPSVDVINELIDKISFAAFAESWDFPVPRTVVLQAKSDLPKLRDLSPPLILKPHVKSRRFGQLYGRRALLEESASNAILALANHDWGVPLVAQEFVRGADNKVYFCLVYIAEDSSRNAYFVGRKLRQWPPDYGNTASAEPVIADPLVELTFKIFGAAGFRGLGSIEYKLDPDGNPWIIEPTIGRTDYQHETAIANGVNLPLIAYCDLMNIPQPRRVRPRHSVRWIDTPEDKKSALRLIAAGRLTKSEYCRSIAGPKVYSLFAWDDPTPFLKMRFSALISKTAKYQP
jgi:D-aspartate ligase